MTVGDPGGVGGALQGTAFRDPHKKRRRGDQWVRVLSYGTGQETRLYLVQVVDDEGTEKVTPILCATGVRLEVPDRHSGKLSLSFHRYEVVIEGQLTEKEAGDLIAVEAADRLRRDKET